MNLLNLDMTDHTKAFKSIIYCFVQQYNAVQDFKYKEEVKGRFKGHS